MTEKKIEMNLIEHKEKYEIDIDSYGELKDDTVEPGFVKNLCIIFDIPFNKSWWLFNGNIWIDKK